MDGTGNHYKVFKLPKKEYERVDIDYDGDVSKYETSLEGIESMVKKFMEFDVSMDIKNQVIPEKHKQIIKSAESVLKANIKADLGIDKVLKLSYSFYKQFVNNMNVKDKIILIYDSRKTPKIRKVFKQV